MQKTLLKFTLHTEIPNHHHANLQIIMRYDSSNFTCHFLRDKIKNFFRTPTYMKNKFWNFRQLFKSPLSHHFKTVKTNYDFANGSSTNDVTPKEEGGGFKKWGFGMISKAYLGWKGEGGDLKIGKFGWRHLWKTPKFNYKQRKQFSLNIENLCYEIGI